MECTLDRFGRIVIPKEVRDALGLRPGSTMQLEKRDGGIELKLIENGDSLVRKGSSLVFVGKPLEDLEKAVERVREERDQAVWGDQE